VNACACDHHGRLGFADVPYPQAQFLRDALTELQSIDYASVSKQAQGNIADSIRQAKLDSLSRFIQKRTAT
jgi:tRNA nucleotidyltransferase (CCA-adding enzyme)